jgi:hypothetical protein
VWGSQISIQSVHEGSKVVSLITRPPLEPKDIILALISVTGWVKPKARVQPEGLGQWKIPNYTIGNRTGGLPACKYLTIHTASYHRKTESSVPYTNYFIFLWGAPLCISYNLTLFTIVSWDFLISFVHVKPAISWFIHVMSWKKTGRKGQIGNMCIYNKLSIDGCTRVWL